MTDIFNLHFYWNCILQNCKVLETWLHLHQDAKFDRISLCQQVTARRSISLFLVRVGTVIHRGLVLYLFALTPFASWHYFLISALCIQFNILWLAAFYYTNSLFLMEYNFWFMPFFIYAHFIRNITKAQNKALVYWIKHTF